MITANWYDIITLVMHVLNHNISWKGHPNNLLRRFFASHTALKVVSLIDLNFQWATFLSREVYFFIRALLFGCRWLKGQPIMSIV